MSTVDDDYVASFPELSHLARQRFPSERNDANSIPVQRFFLAHYAALPCAASCPNVESNSWLHIPSILTYLQVQFQHDLSNDIIHRQYHNRSKQYFVTTRLSDLGDGLMVYINQATTLSDVENPNNYPADLLDRYFLAGRAVTIYYLPHRKEDVVKMERDLSQMTIFETKSLKFNLICRRSNGRYYLKSIKLRKPFVHDLALHYGNKFVPIHEKIIKALSSKDGKGIVLLHGLPGTGKTHYIRYLIDELNEKKVIYVPPDMAKSISKPEMLTFLLSQQNSLLIIEDAENIIRDRNEISVDASQAVANLLNLSDGLLGDAMHIQILATFNCDLGMVDPALLRKGRLIANYKFGKLEMESAKILSDKLGLGHEHISMPMTLAEIYNQDEENELE